MNPRTVDITGKRFGLLTVIAYSRRSNRRTYWVCRCECGDESEYESGNLQQGATTKCKHCRYKIFDRSTFRKRARKLKHKGKIKTIAEWSEELKIPISTIRSRMCRKMPIGKILSPGILPPKPQGLFITFRGETKSIQKWADSLGITRQALTLRLKKWNKEDALTRK